MEQRDITVIGAGIVGVCCALYLQREGYRVTLLDRDAPGEGCSFGNAGMLESNAVAPVATPGLIRQLPRLISDPGSPLAVKWAHLPGLLPWLTRFLLESRPARARANALALFPLVHYAWEAYEPLIADAGCRDLIHDTGWLWVFEREATLDHMAWDQSLRRELGIDMRRVEGDELFELAPALTREAPLGLYFPTTRACSDPHGLVLRLADHLRKEGGRLERREVYAIKPGSTWELDTDGGPLHAQRVVLATGAWSGKFCRGLGEPVPLNTERGYHLMLPESGIEVPVPMMFAEHKFVANLMAGGLRLAGTAELGGMNQAPDWRRADVMLGHAKRLLPGVGERPGERWMGLRPTLPDSLPVIGPSRRHERLWYAFGHQHLGLTLAALTGRLVADSVAGRSAPIEMAPYRVDRF